MSYDTYKHSISKKILVTVLVISSVVTSIITLFQLGFDYREDRLGLEKNIQLVNESYASSVARSVWEIDEFQIKSQLDGITNIPGIKFVQFVAIDGKTWESGQVLVDRYIKRSFELNFTQGASGLTRKLGQLIVYADLQPILTKLYKKIFVIFLSQFIKTLLVSFFIYLMMQRIVTRHLIHITNYAHNVDVRHHAKGDLILHRKSNETEDELDRLAAAINKMKTNLFLSYQKLKYFNQQLEQKVEEKTNLIVDQRQKLEYTAKMSALGEMAGGIAHEINTPLGAMLLNAELIQNENDLPPHVQVLADKIISIGSRISKIINGLKGFSRDASLDDQKTFTVSQWVKDTLDLCSEKFKNRGIQLIVNENSMDLSVRGQLVQLSQTLLNLLNNSFDVICTSQNAWIRIDAKIQDQNLELSVTDSGEGISKEVADKIFQPFFTTKEIGKGTGLGLSLSKGIIESHGGKIFYDESSKNTRFVIQLPLYQRERIIA